MEVRATAQGYYDLKIRNEGDVFTIQSEKEFSKTWMEKVGYEAKAPTKSSGKKASPKEVYHAALEKAVDSGSGANVI